MSMFHRLPVRHLLATALLGAYVNLAAAAGPGRVDGSFTARVEDARAVAVALAGRTATAQVALAAVQHANVGGSFSTRVSGVRVTDVDLGLRSASARVSVGSVQGRP